MRVRNFKTASRCSLLSKYKLLRLFCAETKLRNLGQQDHRI